ncbi:ATP-binding protein [Mesorhizobium sp. M7A.F.Ca.US.006.01.1.1]|uniref:AAA family ATPase n=1 Tax=Mesorhizobium sp. M7A.F.Ca.US.006.01.1.1 TaxID=2496707 RepID=UPI000FCB2FDC|nr:AAA family ATPase [Mesorhizobium sp. M7A.F.Ca.US.006.01.1.1]RUZ73975.1 ATP-binding protein [Mesorhizobium sp. M7A.F.Ca.US.006.01.1.1]
MSKDVMVGARGTIVTSSDAAQSNFSTTLQLLNGSSMTLPVSPEAPLFIVGPNGAGKSGLMLSLYRANHVNAVRIAAHRQTWMESNFVPFSPQDKINTEKNVKGEDNQPNARWKEWNSSVRSGLVIANLIDTDNALARKVREEITIGNTKTAEKLAAFPVPLDVISNLFMGSGIPIKLAIAENSAIVASKNGGKTYSIASLSDGERAALLIAGTVLTAREGSLILVDEPERHLHTSIVTPLLLQLFSKRPDCTFVVSTHELSLPVSCPGARTVLVRDSMAINDDVNRWDLDVLEPGIEIDDATKEAIIGSRRKMLFIEGTQTSLDKPLYEILFPGVSIFPRSSCRDVEHAVASVRDTSAVAWVQAYGIVDQDQLTAEKKATLEPQGVFPLSVYSVEALYYNPIIVKAVAVRQCAVIDGDAEQMVAQAWAHLLAAVSPQVDRLAARMTEQAVKDRISLGMPDWKKIQAGHDVAITVDAQALYKSEREQLKAWLDAGDVNKIIARYPIRETMALEGIVSALQFKSKNQYESAVRKLVMDDAAVKAMLIGFFGGLPAAIA